MAYFSVDECLTILAHYDFDTSNGKYLGGKTIGSHKYSDEQLLSITNNVVDRMGLPWLMLVWDREDLTKTKCKISSYNEDWIISPYYKYNKPRIPLPANYKEEIANLKKKATKLEVKIAERTQQAGKGIRQIKKAQTVQA